MQKTKLFQKDFTLMVIGQIISLFGNTVLRFALPLYLFGQTGSATLLGVVSAVSFIPMVLLAPVGGIVADRVNKRNVMVILDFATAALVLFYLLSYRAVSLVPLMVVVLMLLYGIQGAYQPAVQASLPALLQESQLVQGGAVVNAVQSLTGLVGPVLGGIVYSAFGLWPILVVSTVCFFVSAVMEILIKIPFTPQAGGQSVLQIVKGDLRQSFAFVTKEQPIIGKSILLIAAFNLFLSSALVVGALVIVTGKLGFGEATGNTLYGYTQGAFAAGGLLGGLLAGVVGQRLDLGKSHLLLGAMGLLVLPMGTALLLGLPAMASYLVFTVCGFALMACASVFSILALAFVQKTTPAGLIGKVISVVMAVCMCAQPLGQALYGWLFDTAPAWAVLFFAAAATLALAVAGRATFRTLGKQAGVAAQAA